MSYTLGELAEKVGARLHGDASYQVDGVATLQNAQAQQISFLANPRYRKQLATSKAGAVVLSEDDLSFCTTNALVSRDPYLSFAKISAELNKIEPAEAGIHPSAVVSADSTIHPSVCIGPQSVVESGVTIGAGSVIGAGCFIGKNSSIGEEVFFSANVTICYGSKISDRVRIHPGVVIGSDGFGFANNKGEWLKVPQTGAVQIGHDVEIGANTTIDRGALDDTIIGNGVKLDNQIQIAHNVQIGAHTAVAACVGIAGSAKIGKHCAIAGSVGILGHLEIVDNVHITAMSLVTGSIKTPGIYSAGTPLEPSHDWRKNFVRFKQLDEMARRLSALEKKLEK